MACPSMIRLGHILLLVYINDLASIQIQGNSTIFANDTPHTSLHGKYIEKLKGAIIR